MLRLSEREIKNLKNAGMDIERIESAIQQMTEILKAEKIPF